MAAVHAALETTLKPGDVLVAPDDGYPGIRGIARDHLAPRGIEVRLVPTDDAAVREALPGATAVFLESPSNPALNVIDIAAIARDTDAFVAVDNTLAGPLHQNVFELGADMSIVSATKYLTGHSDINMGYVAARDTAKLRQWRDAHRCAAGTVRDVARTPLARDLPAAARAPDGQRAGAGDDARRARRR